MPSQAAWKWAQAQWGEVQLGDQRRQRRAVALGAALAEASAPSLPQQLQSRTATQAAYRRMDTEAVTHAALIEPHRQATRQAAQACGPAPVLFVQDDTYLDFTHRKSLAGVGRIGNDRGQGFCLHSCLALAAQSGALLGLADQRYWARRGPGHRGESTTQRALRRTEAAVWAECLESIGPVPAGATWVSLADRNAVAGGLQDHSAPPRRSRPRRRVELKFLAKRRHPRERILSPLAVQRRPGVARAFPPPQVFRMDQAPHGLEFVVGELQAVHF